MPRRRFKLLKQPADIDNMEGFDLTGIVDDDLLVYNATTTNFEPAASTTLAINASQVSGLAEAAQDATASLITNGTGISWSYNDGLNTLTGTVSLAPFSTTNLAEGTNLYYTTARFDTAFATKTTTNLTEGTNLYFTDARAISAVTPALVLSKLLTVDGAGSALDADLLDGVQGADYARISVANTFTSGSLGIAGGTPFLSLTETDQSSDEQIWAWIVNAKVCAFQTYTAAFASRSQISFARGVGAAVTNITFGNTTDNAAVTFSGTGTSTFNGQITGKLAIKSDSATSGVGYATGAGGTVTQITSRTTGVTLNKICGSITLFSVAGTTSWQTFTVTNSAVAATDVVKVCQKSGTDKNMIHVTAVAAGSFDITFATTGGTTVEQPVFNFAVIKAVAA